MTFRNIRRSRVAGVLLAVTAVACGVGVGSASPVLAGPVALSSAQTGHAQTGQAQRGHEHTACQTPAKGEFRCLALWHPVQPVSSTRTLGAASATPKAVAVQPPTVGLSPANIKAAYKLPSTGGQGQTVAIVDAYDNPNVEADLAAYRAAWKLPACTTANKCFTKVDQRGGKVYPDGDPGWGVEIDLDVQAVSAACADCKILLVEADEPSIESIGAAVNEAVKLGAKVVSNSYGQDEYNGAIADGAAYYTHPGVAIVASSGDYGFGPASFPAVLPNVWAIGGTYLSPSKKTGWKEKAWEYAGSGCSAWITKPAAQKDANCSMRTVADISAVADSKDGFAEYDTYGLDADNGWIGVSGTSLSAPLISAIIGLAGNATKAALPSYAYAHRTGLKDVVGGSNGYCGGDYLCTGVKGYDAPTGLGAPSGLKSL